MAEWLDATVTEKVQWTDTLFSIRFEADLPTFKAGQFARVALDIDGERVARPYSLVNAPHETPNDIYFNIVPEGPLTNRLVALEPGDRFYVANTLSGVMTLDQVPARDQLWLMATGTALGPFLSMLKTQQPWEQFRDVVVCHSVRYAEELNYAETREAIQEAHADQMRFIPLVTRESHPGSLATRIPQAIRDGTLEAQAGLTIEPERAHVMLCGNSDMIEDTHAVLEERGLKRHRRRDPGHITTEKYH